MCVSTPVGFSALVVENGTTVQNNSVNFVYSACNGAGDEIDCTEIGNKIAEQVNGTEFAKALEELHESKKRMGELSREMQEMSNRMAKHFEQMEKSFGSFGWGFDFGAPWSFFDDIDMSLDKRDADVEASVKSSSKSNVKMYAMHQGACKNSTITKD